MLSNKKPTKRMDVLVDWFRKAGRSAWELHETTKTIYTNEHLMWLEQRNEEDFMLQIAALTWNARYDEAEKMAKVAALSYPTNVYFNKFSSLNIRLNEVQKHQGSYLVAPSPFNSGKGEMTSFLSGNNLIYCSRKDRTRTLNPFYQRDHGFYYHLRQISVLNYMDGHAVLKEEAGHCGPLTENSKGTMRLLTRNFRAVAKGNTDIPVGLFFMHQINGIWTETGAFPYNSDKYNTGQACFGVNDSVIVFTSNRSGGFGGTDLYYSIYRNGIWLKPVNLGGKVNTSRDECFPYIQGDSLFFSSDGHCGFGGLDVFQTTMGLLDTVVNLGNEMNSSSDDFGLVGNQHMTKGFLTSNRLGNIDRIYSFERREPKIDLFISLEGDPVEIDSASYQAFINHQPLRFKKDLQGKTSAVISLGTDNVYTIRCAIEGFDSLQPIGVSTVGIRRDTVFHQGLSLTKLKKRVYLIGIDKATKERIDSLNFSLDDIPMGTAPWVEINNGRPTSSFYVSSKGFLDVDTLINWENGHQTDTLFLAMTPITKGTIVELEDIYYDFNKATLRTESKETLDRLYEMLAREDVKIELGSHTDSRGSTMYNFNLSEERARTCFSYLVERGIDPKKIIPKGYGESIPKIICEKENCSEDIHQMNRRTEIRFLESSKNY
jgi:outer membrane protein OmpA-like peptidoglycan-associated protein